MRLHPFRRVYKLFTFFINECFPRRNPFFFLNSLNFFFHPLIMILIRSDQFLVHRLRLIVIPLLLLRLLLQLVVVLLELVRVSSVALLVNAELVVFRLFIELLQLLQLCLQTIDFCVQTLLFRVCLFFQQFVLVFRRLVDFGLFYRFIRNFCYNLVFEVQNLHFPQIFLLFHLLKLLLQRFLTVILDCVQLFSVI